MTASPEVLCSQVRAVHPLLCRDVQLFHFRRHSDGKTSAGERTTADRDARRKKKDREVHTTSVASEKHQAGQRHDGTQRNGRILSVGGEGRGGEGEADQHRVETVMSNWSDTREGGRQTEMSGGRRTERDAERETCVKPVITKYRQQKTQRTRGGGDARRFGETYTAM